MCTQIKALICLCIAAGAVTGCGQDKDAEPPRVSGKRPPPATAETRSENKTAETSPEGTPARADVPIHELSVPSPLPVYVEPYYNSRNMAIQAGEWSDRLAQADRSSIRQIADEMSAQWDALPFETMYVVAIRLFDLGWKTDAVFWFYSAQYRGRLYMLLVDPARLEAGLPEWERRQVNNAFYQTVGPFINTWAFRQPHRLVPVLHRVVAANENIPDFSRIYPMDRFVERSDWQMHNSEIRDGLEQLTASVQSMSDDATPMLTDSKLHDALKAGDRERFTNLLQDGADPDVRDQSGLPVMNAAARERDPFWLKTLLVNGGDPDSVNRQNGGYPGATPLFTAIHYYRPDNVKLLIEFGADVNVVAKSFETPVCYAVGQRAFGIALLLLDAGANPVPSPPSLSVFSNGMFDPVDGTPPVMELVETPGQDNLPSIEEQARDYNRLKKRLIELGYMGR